MFYESIFCMGRCAIYEYIFIIQMSLLFFDVALTLIQLVFYIMGSKSPLFSVCGWIGDNDPMLSTSNTSQVDSQYIVMMKHPLGRGKCMGLVYNQEIRGSVYNKSSASLHYCRFT